MPSDADRIAAFVRDRPASGIRLVGVDGPSGSGKTRLATRVADRLGAPIIPIDDFVSWDDVAGWWPRFDAQVLTPLLAGRDAVWQARDWTDWHGSSLGAWRTQPWQPVVVIEGVTATRRATVGRLCCAVWVDAPPEVRLARGLARDRDLPGAAELWRRWSAAEDEFFTADGTRDRADFIVDSG